MGLPGSEDWTRQAEGGGGTSINYTKLKIARWLRRPKASHKGGVAQPHQAQSVDEKVEGCLNGSAGRTLFFFFFFYLETLQTNGCEAPGRISSTLACNEG